MNPFDLPGVTAFIGCLMYLVIVILMVRLRGLKRGVHRLFLLYLVISLAWNVIQLLDAFNQLQPAVVSHVSRSAIMALVFLYYLLTRIVLLAKGKRATWIASVLGALWLILFVIPEFDLLDLQAISLGDYKLDREGLALSILVSGWVGFLTAITVLVLQPFQGKSLPLVRNRAYYWTIAIIFISGGDVLFFSGFSPLGNMLHWIGVLIAAGVAGREHLPDTRQIERLALNYLVMTLLTANVMLVGLFFAPSLFEQFSQTYNPTLAGALISLFLAALLSPLWIFSQRIVRRLFPVKEYDPNRILREYSHNVSNILDPDLLATVAVGLVSEAIEIQHGFLYLVDFEMEEGIGNWRLRLAKGMGEHPIEPGVLAGNSPIALYLRQERKPLRQTDIDLFPQFQTADLAERDWFTSLKSDIYLPIYTKDDWVGMIALGPKLNGLPYFESDLTLLATLADQTAVALQNARLVESLMRLNNDFRRAYAAMEQANRHLKQVNIQLENLDRTKSDFISVASHELRTPLTVMRGYNEMLMEEATINSNPFQAKLVNGIYSGIMRMHEIVNSMLDMASIDTRSLELKVGSLSLSIIIHGICDKLANSLKERNITLETENLRDLPEIEGDPEALKKVFHNVIQNAIQYTPDGGKITIHGVSVSSGQLGLPDGGVEVIIADTGIGIDSEYLELIFTKFYQTGEVALHSTGKTKFKGSGPGLGLSIARGIVEAHRGKIWAESEGNDETTCPGSQFHIVLPLHYHTSPS